MNDKKETDIFKGLVVWDSPKHKPGDTTDLMNPTSDFKATEIFATADVDCHIYLIERNGQTFLINTRGGCAFVPKE